jgi:cysteinyl-tRNA synthetase
VNLDNEKMSKSLGNFLTLRTACPSPDDVRAYRYLVVSSQYRNPLAFTPEAMKAAKNAVKRVDKVKAELEKALLESPVDGAALDAGAAASALANSAVPKAMENFKAAIRDDLSMPRAAASLFALVKAAEGEFKRVAKQEDGAAPLDVAGLKAILEAMQDMDRIFGIFYRVPGGEDEEQKGVDGDSPVEVPMEVMDLVSQRSAAKDAKDWELADSLRKRITELGYAVKDVKDGEPIVSRAE